MIRNRIEKPKALLKALVVLFFFSFEIVSFMCIFLPAFIYQNKKTWHYYIYTIFLQIIQDYLVDFYLILMSFRN